MELVDKIMAWEDDRMSSEDEAAFFQELIDSGMAWKLQGVYGRRAQALIRQGVCHLPSVDAGRPNNKGE